MGLIGLPLCLLPKLFSRVGEGAACVLVDLYKDLERQTGISRDSGCRARAKALNMWPGRYRLRLDEIFLGLGWESAIWCCESQSSKPLSLGKRESFMPLHEGEQVRTVNWAWCCCKLHDRQGKRRVFTAWTGGGQHFSAGIAADSTWLISRLMSGHTREL